MGREEMPSQEIAIPASTPSSACCLPFCCCLVLPLMGSVEVKFVYLALLTEKPGKHTGGGKIEKTEPEIF